MILPAEQAARQFAQSDTIVRTKEFFSENSPLKRAAEFGGRIYERRIQQEQMAFAVSEALEQNHNLCVEAPTGVGKSFAYLVPAIFHARALRQPVLVTTETITLQEQLVDKDLPLLKELTGLDFTFALAKGRSNYLCQRRCALASGEHSGEVLSFANQKSDLERICEWARETKTGRKSELAFRCDPLLWSCVCCESANCLGPKCAYYHQCFYWRVRKQWDKADIIVTNHALFFTDLKIREIEHQETCPLPPYCAVIFDEAHTLEDNAANHLGIQVANNSLRYFLNRLFNPATGRGMLVKPGENSMSVRGRIAVLQDALPVFFSQFDRDLTTAREDCLRVLKPGHYEDTFSTALGELEKILRDYADTQDSAEFKTELEAQLLKCMAFRDELAAFVNMSFDEHVYWIEGRGQNYVKQREIELIAAPLNISEILRNILFSKDIPIILTSATLAVRDSLDYYVGRVGFCGGEGLILDSPFDYRKQVTLYLSRSMPLPTDRSYNEAAADRIGEFVEKTNGHAFVLFTSFSMLQFCAERLSNRFLAHGIRLLEHGEEMSRSAMLAEFKKKGSSVIFGASSFWTGVDVPGDALANVVITKLPFAVPSHPLIQARCERIQEDGGNPFRDYSIPDAVLKFRQGVGRLIRSRTDHGIIVVLDPRVVSRQYGRLFLQALPPCPVEYF